MSKKDDVFGDVFGHVFKQADKAFIQMDKAFEHIDRALEDISKTAETVQTEFLQSTKDAVNAFLRFPDPFPSFPPINVCIESFNLDPSTFQISETPIVKYAIELALSGYTSKDVDVNVFEANGFKTLVIEGKGVNHNDRRYSGTSVANISWYRRGIAGRAFKLNFPLLNNIKVESVVLKDGLLTIRLVIEPPAATSSCENIKING